MADRKRIALIHATRVSIAPVEDAAKAHWPEAELISILDEGLSIDRAAGTQPVSLLSNRIVALARYAESIDPDGILYTCSAFSDGIEQAASSSSLPVLKPNEAMFDEAFALGNRAVLLYTFPASVAGMEREFRDEASRRGSSATIRSIFADGARASLSAGDEDTHNAIIASTAATVTDADVIMLAHFSMAPAQHAVREATDIPVLTSPESAIRKIRKQTEQG